MEILQCRFFSQLYIKRVCFTAVDACRCYDTLTPACENVLYMALSHLFLLLKFHHPVPTACFHPPFFGTIMLFAKIKTAWKCSGKFNYLQKPCANLAALFISNISLEALGYVCLALVLLLSQSGNVQNRH